MRQLLDHAAEQGYGIPAFNVNNLEQVQAVMTAAAEVGAPVILQASAGARKYAGEAFIKHLIQAAVEAYPQVPLGCTRTTGRARTRRRGHAQAAAALQRAFDVDVAGRLRESRQAPAHRPVEVFAIAAAGRACDEEAAQGMRVAADRRRRVRVGGEPGGSSSLMVTVSVPATEIVMRAWPDSRGRQTHCWSNVPVQSPRAPPPPQGASTMVSASAVVRPAGSVKVLPRTLTLALLGVKCQVDRSVPAGAGDFEGHLTVKAEAAGVGHRVSSAGRRLDHKGVAAASTVEVVLPFIGLVNVPVPDSRRSADVTEKLTSAW
jgi:hypothetical protein